MLRQLTVSALFGIAMLGAMVGCDQAEPVATEADTAQQRAKENADALANSAKQATADSSKEVKDAAADAARRAQSAAEKTTEAVNDQAQSLLNKAQEAVRESRWTDAEALADQLDKLVGQLPPEWADKVKTLRASIDAGKNRPGQ